jgi:hypothetical protein
MPKLKGERATFDARRGEIGMSDLWYYAEGSETIGPIDLDALAQALKKVGLGLCVSSP